MGFLTMDDTLLWISLSSVVSPTATIIFIRLLNITNII
jgi:hypothetical protein